MQTWGNDRLLQPKYENVCTNTCRLYTLADSYILETVNIPPFLPGLRLLPPL